MHLDDVNEHTFSIIIIIISAIVISNDSLRVNALCDEVKLKYRTFLNCIENFPFSDILNAMTNRKVKHFSSLPNTRCACLRVFFLTIFVVVIALKALQAHVDIYVRECNSVQQRQRRRRCRFV